MHKRTILLLITRASLGSSDVRRQKNNSNGPGRQMTMTNCVLRKSVFYGSNPCLLMNNRALQTPNVWETDYCSQRICFLPCAQTRHASDWVTGIVIHTCKLYPAPFINGTIPPPHRFIGPKESAGFVTMNCGETWGYQCFANCCPRLVAIRKHGGSDGQLCLEAQCTEDHECLII